LETENSKVKKLIEHVLEMNVKELGDSEATNIRCVRVIG
jgi:hypothetical protein